MTQEEADRKRQLEEILEAPCPQSRHGDHGDPDNSGRCIYCCCVIDITDYDYLSKYRHMHPEWPK